jgi:hypothetical protein
VGGSYGEIMHSGQQQNIDPAADGSGELPNGDEQNLDGELPSRIRGEAVTHQTGMNGRKSRAHIAGYNAVDEMEDESDASSSGHEWEGGDEDDEMDEDDNEEDGDTEMTNGNSDDEEDDTGHKSLVVSLRVTKPKQGEPESSSASIPRDDPSASSTTRIADTTDIKPSIETPAPMTPLTNGDGAAVGKEEEEEEDPALVVVNGSSSHKAATDAEAPLTNGTTSPFASGALKEPPCLPKTETPAQTVEMRE